MGMGCRDAGSRLPLWVPHHGPPATAWLHHKTPKSPGCLLKPIVTAQS